jgi:hypothetical protein
MADTDRDRSEPRNRDTGETERDRVSSSNDSDQTVEREGVDSEHNRGYDDAVRGSGRSAGEQSEDIDPDSARSDVDRDDMIDEI